MNTNARHFAPACLVLLALCTTNISQLTRPAQRDADALVNDLRDLPTPLPASPRSDGTISPAEQQRRRLYEALFGLGPSGVLALSRALRDEDVHLRKNAALALNVLAGGWYDLAWPKLDIKPALPTLVAALEDNDAQVRGWSAQAIGDIGPDAATAVPDLVRLLSDDDEGARNSACIALRFIGPAAKQALPDLKKALSDPSKDVRRFAALAIENVER